MNTAMKMIAVAGGVLLVLGVFVGLPVVGMMQPAHPDIAQQAVTACERDGGLPTVTHHQVGTDLDVNGRPQPHIETDVTCVNPKENHS